MRIFPALNHRLLLRPLPRGASLVPTGPPLLRARRQLTPLAFFRSSGRVIPAIPCLYASAVLQPTHSFAGPCHLCKNEWNRVAAIGTRRWFCMFGVVGGRLYVAGGIDTSEPGAGEERWAHVRSGGRSTSISLALVGSVEAYGVDEGRWMQVRGDGRSGISTSGADDTAKAVGTAVASARAELMTGGGGGRGGGLVAKNIRWGQRLGVAFNPRSNAVTELPPTIVQQVVSGECCYAAIQLSPLLAPRPLSLSSPLLSLPLSSLRPSPLSAPLLSPPLSSLGPSHLSALLLSPLLSSPRPSSSTWMAGPHSSSAEHMFIFDFACCGVVAWNDCPLLTLSPFRSPGMAGPNSIGAGAHVASDGPSATHAETAGAAEEEEGERGEGEGAGRNDEERGGRSDGEEEDEVFEEEGDEEVVIPVKVIPGPE
ncbi:unnamed protein product [Closterium sp. Naga37s-1]|nr:unnamed protein product [Closterium sp. Naga37s-1]